MSLVRPGGNLQLQDPEMALSLSTLDGKAMSRFAWQLVPKLLPMWPWIGIGCCLGIVFHDIRFRGNRIVYELALQDQFVAYSGYAGGGQTVYMDSYFGIGGCCFRILTPCSSA